MIDGPPPGPAAQAELLERIAASDALRRSQRLRDLLLFLGRQSIGKPIAAIREQDIGAAVFGRPRDYDTNVDNIVRVNVSELRKRLHVYFHDEAPHEPTLVEIPRGGYLPVFLLRPIDTAVAAIPEPTPPFPEPETPTIPPAEDPAPPPPPATRFAPLNAALLLALLLAAATAVFFYAQTRSLQSQLHPWMDQPNLRQFWSTLFVPGQQLDIVTADTSYSIAQDILQRPISLDDYLDYRYKDFGNLPGLNPQTRDALNLVLERNTGSVGDFAVAERIISLNAHAPELKLAAARAYSTDSIKHNNVILIGSRDSNPWVELYNDHMNFDVQYDPVRRRAFVLNRAPQPGEQPLYQTSGRNRAYSVITFLPNLTPNRYTLILAGTDSQGTQAAGEFITSPEGLAQLRQQLPANQNPFFEVVLLSSRLEGTVLRTSVVAMRGHQH